MSPTASGSLTDGTYTLAHIPVLVWVPKTSPHPVADPHPVAAEGHRTAPHPRTARVAARCGGR